MVMAERPSAKTSHYKVKSGQARDWVWEGRGSGAWLYRNHCVLSVLGQGRGDPEEGSDSLGARGQQPWPGWGKWDGGLFRGCFLVLSCSVSVRDGEKNLQLKNVTFNLTLEPGHLQICLLP